MLRRCRDDIHERLWGLVHVVSFEVVPKDQVPPDVDAVAVHDGDVAVTFDPAESVAVGEDPRARLVASIGVGEAEDLRWLRGSPGTRHESSVSYSKYDTWDCERNCFNRVDVSTF